MFAESLLDEPLCVIVTVLQKIKIRQVEIRAYVIWVRADHLVKLPLGSCVIGLAKIQRSQVIARHVERGRQRDGLFVVVDGFVDFALLISLFACLEFPYGVFRIDLPVFGFVGQVGILTGNGSVT